MPLEKFIDFIVRLLDFSVYCAVHPLNWIGCNKFWGFCFLFTEIVLFLFCLFLSKKLYRERAEWNDYLRRKENREKVADEKTMDRFSWKGDF